MIRNFIFILLAIPSMICAHPIHVSVCEIFHNEPEGRLEIVIKIFADDFQDVLEERTGEKVGLMEDEEEHEQMGDFILEYLEEKLIIEINGNPTELIYDHTEVEDIASFNYLFIDHPGAIQEVRIQNSVMVHWFNDQVNVVHLDCNGKLNSTFFSKGREVDTFEF